MASKKRWNWQQEDWPVFRYDQSKLEKLEGDFLHQSGILSGSIRHIGAEDKRNFTIELISNEALKTSEIEGEILNRESLQSSVRRYFGLATDNRQIPPAEQGIAEMMSDLYHHFGAPLTHESLYGCHERLMNGRRDLKSKGGYRQDTAPMQVVTGSLDAPRIHFEAPPSERVMPEMTRFIEWFNRAGPDGPAPLPALLRAGLTHHHFICIHPFEDGNGRISRALCAKVLSQALGHPTLIALSQTINSRRKAYYEILEENNSDNEITGWLVFFAGTILEAQSFTQKAIGLLITKAKFFEALRGRLNPRQEKVLLRMFREEPEGFKGGLSAENYLTIAATSRATATRDLQDLVAKRALLPSGVLKGTRYSLNLPLPGDDLR